MPKVDRYELSDWFCPACGKKTVWVEMDDGDYYDGPEHFCSSCGGTMCHPGKGDATYDKTKDLMDKLSKHIPAS